MKRGGVAGNRGGRGQPKPSALHEIQGTARKDRHDAAREPSLRVDLRDPPPGMSLRQIETWRRMIGVMCAGVIKEPDADALRLYCELEERHNDAEMRRRELDGVMFIENGAGTLAVHPIHRILNE